jgi:hypothetical protein
LRLDAFFIFEKRDPATAVAPAGCKSSKKKRFPQRKKERPSARSAPPFF